MSEQSIYPRRFESPASVFGGTRASSKSPIRHIDLSLMVTILLLTMIGAIAVRSASRPALVSSGLDPNVFVKRQLIFFCIAMVLFLATTIFDYRQSRAVSPLAYAAGVVLLIVVLTPLVEATKGAQRWIDIGVFRIQPSELMKVVVIVVLSGFLARERMGHGFAEVAAALGIVMLPAVLVYLQPDLGTMMVFIAIAFAILLAAGVQLRWLLAVILIGTVSFALAVQFGALKEYQVARLTAFLDSEPDERSAGYNLAQSKIAIGSGGLSGKGLLKGTQTNLKYVPEQHTDFVFTAIGEETGFVGATLILSLFSFLLWRCLRIAMLSKDLFGTLLAVGIGMMFAFQVFVNIGMTIGIMPITGIPLPFVSYGGSSLITNYVAVGLLMNIHMRRFL